MGFYADGSVMGEAVDVVTTKLKELKTLSDQYNATLSKALADIGNIKMDDVPAPTSIDLPPIDVPTVDISDAPSYTEKALAVPDMPVLHNLDNLLQGLDDIDLGMQDMPQVPHELMLDIPSAPILNDVPTPAKPSFDMAVNLPPTPILERPNVPVRPAIDVDVDLPAPPDMSLPEMAKLFDVSLPVWDDNTLPVWHEATVKQLDSANFTFNHDWWHETDYQSKLYDRLLITAQNMLDPSKIGNFGLPDGVVNALFNKPFRRDYDPTTEKNHPQS